MKTNTLTRTQGVAFVKALHSSPSTKAFLDALLPRGWPAPEVFIFAPMSDAPDECDDLYAALVSIVEALGRRRKPTEADQELRPSEGADIVLQRVRIGAWQDAMKRCQVVADSEALHNSHRAGAMDCVRAISAMIERTKCGT